MYQKKPKVVEAVITRIPRSEVPVVEEAPASVTGKPKRKSRAVNRPHFKSGPKPKKIDFAQVERYAAQGLRDIQIYRLLGISQTTFYNRKREQEEFDACIARGRDQGEADITNVALGKAVGGDNDMIKFILERRCGWNKSETVKIEGDALRGARIAAATVEIGPETRTLLEALGVNTRRGDGPINPDDFEG